MKKSPPDQKISVPDIKANPDNIETPSCTMPEQPNFDCPPRSGDRTLAALRRGDHQAYHDIYYTYKESIEYFLLKLLRSEDQAAELTQNIFVNLWDRRETLDPTKSIKSFLFSVAKNSALNYFKHLRVHDRYIHHELYNEGLDYDSNDEMVARETSYLVEIAVSRMPAKRRKVFELSRYENLSNDEIARRLNMNKLTVASHLAQAMKEIREILALFYILFIAQ